MAAIAAHRAREEALWRRENPGKVRFYLLDAPGEPPKFSAEGQSGIRSVVAAIRDNRIEADASFMTMDAVDAVGGYTGEIALLLQAVSPVLTGILGAWLQSRVGRKLRLKFDGIEIEANNAQEVTDMLQQVREFRDQQEKP
jgi:hypothetical protein